MNDNATAIETLFEKAGVYGKTSIELFRLKAIDRSADIVSSLAVKLVIAIVVALFLVILSIGAALWLGEWLSRPYYGFFAVAAIYAAIGVVLFAYRKLWIKAPANNALITLMMQKQQNEKN